MTKLITRAELAKLVGVSKPMVTRYCQRGLPVAGDKIPVDRALRWLKHNKLAQGKPGDDKKPTAGRKQSGADETYAEASRRKETALANLRELELTQKRGEFVSLAEINAHIAGMVIHSRDILLRLPGEMSDRLAKETKPVKIRKLLESEVDRCLRGLAEFKPDAR